MLERATACLDTGARLSVRCARRASRSNRSLGPQFWTHGAGDLELSPWTTSHSSQSPLEVRGDRKQPHFSPKTKHSQAASAAPTESPFLDFLYPPQALALLHRGGNQRVERWEKRNERRLPKGFVHATRGFSSKSKKALHVARRLSRELQEEYVTDTSADAHPEAQPDEGSPVVDAFTTMESQDADTTTDSDALTGASPADLAEIPASQKEFRNFLTSYSDDAVLKDPAKSLEYTESAWAFYERLEERGRENVKIRFLDWLSQNHNEAAETHCLELYHSIPDTHRTMAVYKAALSAFVRSNLFGLAEQGHAEALERLSNGHELSIWLCSYAIEKEMWDLASRIKHQLYAKHGVEAKTWVDAMFWRQITDIPDLLPKAISLSKHTRMLSQADYISTEFQEFSMGMFKEAIIQEYTIPHTGNSLTVSSAQKTIRDGQIRYLIGRVQLTSSNAPDFFSKVLSALTKSTSKVQYYDAHKTVSYLYRQYRAMSGVIISEALLVSILQRLLDYAEEAAIVSDNAASLSLSTIREDWIRFHGKLGVHQYHSIMRHFARTGDHEGVQAYFDLLRQDYPEYKTQEPALWTLVYVHARRADLKSAKSAFEQINSFAVDAGRRPDLRIWNALLHAHSRAADLEGGLAALERLIESGEKPDSYSFHPILEIYSARGDVDSVEALLEQYDSLTGLPRRTELYGSLMTAHINADDIPAARNILTELHARVKANEVEGSLTGCFNILLTSLALAREGDDTMQVYRWMRRKKVEADEFTYAALMQSLVSFRQTDQAWNILTSVMPQKGLQPRAFHYALIMTGFVRQRAYRTALDVHKRMMRKNIRPTLNTDAIFAKATALAGIHPAPRSRPNEIIDYSVETIITELEEVFRDPAAGLATKESQFFSAMEHQTPHALVFSHLIYTYAAADLLEAVEVLVKRYAEVDGKSLDDTLKSMPIRILTSIMPAYIQAQRWGEVQQCWDLAREQTNAIAMRDPVPRLTQSGGSGDGKPADLLKLSVAKTTLPGQILRSENQSSKTLEMKKAERPKPAAGLRIMLSQPLRHYITALAFQSRFSDMIATVTSVLKDGYALDRLTWNVFIEHLLRSTPPLTLLAFRLTEKYLIPSFPGWMRGKPVITFSQRVQGLSYMRKRYMSPQLLMPRYKTLVKLAASFLEIRRRDALGVKKNKASDAGLDRFVGTTKQIRQYAPRTLFVVQSMPNVTQDNLQEALLRRRE